MNKLWLIEMADRSLIQVKANHMPKSPDYLRVFPGLFDPITGAPERGEWLQIESVDRGDGVFEDRGTVNQSLKDQILQDEADAKAAKDAEKQSKDQDFKDKVKDIKKIKQSDLSAAPGIRNAILQIKDTLVELEKRILNIEGE